MNTLDVVHDFLRRQVKPGAVCIDATAGKGRDTALLFRLAGKNGRVIAFDIQEAAVEQTRALLAEQGLTAEVVQDMCRTGWTGAPGGIGGRGSQRKP